MIPLCPIMLPRQNSTISIGNHLILPQDQHFIVLVFDLSHKNLSFQIQVLVGKVEEEKTGHQAPKCA